MIKKGLVFGLIAVLSAVFVFTGCNTGTSNDSGSSSPVVTPDGVVVDRTVTSTNDLISALADKEVDVVAYILSADVTSGNIIIPAGKTVYLLNSTTAVKTFGPGELEVRGALIVSESTILAASNTNRVYLGNSGSIQIQAGGELRTNARSNVSDLTDAGTKETSAIGKVRYAGGSALTITGEPGLTTTEIGTLLGYITAGTALSVVDIITPSSRLALVAPLTQVKPSDIAGIPGISAARTLAVIPAAAETESSITIPAGAEVEITQALPTVKTLVVNGTFTAPSVGNGTDAVTVTVSTDAELTVTTPIKFDATTSKIASGGSFSGSATADTGIPAAAGATVNGSAVKEGETIKFLTGAVSTAVTIEAGTTYQIKGTATVTAAITVAEGGILLIPEGAALTIGQGGSIADTSAGKIIVDGGIVTGSPLAPSLAPDTDYNPTGLTITYAEKNLKTGAASFKLGGTVEGGITNDAINNIWGIAATNSLSGPWSWAVLVGILPAGTTAANGIEIKQTNLSLLYYKGSNLNDVAQNVTGKPTSAPTITTSGPPSIYLDPDNAWAIKWAKYGTDRNAVDGSNNGFGVLLWSGASPKTATIEITPPASGGSTTPSPYIVTVDWSGVTINN